MMMFEDRSGSDHSTPSPRPSAAMEVDATAAASPSLQHLMRPHEEGVLAPRDRRSPWEMLDDDGKIRGAPGAVGSRLTPPIVSGEDVSRCGMSNTYESFSSNDQYRRRSTGDMVSGPHNRPQQRHEGPLTLKEWVVSHIVRNGNNMMEVAEWRKYLEKSVHILHSVVEKIIDGHRDSTDDTSCVHPNFITTKNFIVQELGDEKILAGLVECDEPISRKNEEDESKRKYRAMEALGQVAYEMFMLGKGPDISKRSSKRSSSMTDALSISGKTVEEADDDEENEIFAMLRKNPRMVTSEEKESSIISTMLDAHVPFPLCRFVSDLLDDGDDGMLGRSEHSFSSFDDILADLKQMVAKPDAFLHASSPDRWRLSFGDKVYGRDRDTKALMDAAGRVSTLHYDPLFDELSPVRGERKEVVMVAGHSGAGKSRLVRLVGASLEKKGWRFLQCKFDSVAHPEPLSILANSFDGYFGSFASCPEHGTGSSFGDVSAHSTELECTCSELPSICQRLEQIIGLEGLGVLAKHIPSLHLVMDVSIPLGTVDVTETEMQTLFGKLLQALSSQKTPVLLFVDDLQWADHLSLAMMSALVKGARPDLLYLTPSDSDNETSKSSHSSAEEDISVLFVGSYRDNEVDDNHPLAKVIDKFQADKAISLTNISLSGFTPVTLTEMLSASLSLPARRVRPLSELVIQKTDGQPLFIIQFLRTLATDNLLTHSFDRGWEWDADSIDICPITDSVAELFAFKLRRLPKDILLGLQILSCFGSQIDRRVLRYLGDYDGESSVDISAAIDVAVSEGLLERAAHFVSFAHDTIQKASIDSIEEDAMVPLLRKLARALIKNASKADKLDSILFSVVDLVNRVGSDATPSGQERELFADLNLRAGSKALSVPDFAAAARYAESGISFLSDSCWEMQYDLTLGLYETAALSHFSCLGGDRDQLRKRIDAVFKHAKDFSDQFKTYCVWIELQSMTDLSRAIEECLTVLVGLGEPFDPTNIGFSQVCEELTKCKDQFLGEKKTDLLPANQLADVNKVRAMKILVFLFVYYHRQKSFLGAVVACQMIKITMKFGHCGDSAFGAAAFAAGLINILDEIDEATAWGRVALSLMKIHGYIPMPNVTVALYGIVFIWKDPLQSTLEPLAQGIRLSLETGNVEFAVINSGYYTVRSFNCGKCIGILTGEIEALARQFGTHFGHDASTNSRAYSALLQFLLTPLYNTLRHLEGERNRKDEDASFPLDKVQIVNNDDIMKATLETKQFVYYHTILTYQTTTAFLFRDMDSALRYANIYCQHFLSIDERVKFSEIFNILYEGLITLYTARKTGEEHYRKRGEKALLQMKEWSIHSDWNFRNKSLLLQAEWHYTMKDYDKAASCYECSIQAAEEHKFFHEEAVASELAGYFFLERGLHPNSYQFFLRSIGCYKKWGAHAVAKRVEDSIRDLFDVDLMRIMCPVDTSARSGSSLGSEPPSPFSKKRQLNEASVDSSSYGTGGALLPERNAVSTVAEQSTGVPNHTSSRESPGAVLPSPSENGTTPDKNVLEGKVFVLAGLFVEFTSDRRKADIEVTKLIESFGGSVVVRFSKNTTHLLAGKYTDTAKVNGARKRDPPVEIINLNRLQRLLVRELTLDSMHALPPLSTSSFKEGGYEPALSITNLLGE